MLYSVQTFNKGRGWLCSRKTVLVGLGWFTPGLGHFERFEVKRKGHMQQLQHCHRVTHHPVTIVTISLAVASGRGTQGS